MTDRPVTDDVEARLAEIGNIIARFSVDEPVDFLYSLVRELQAEADFLYSLVRELQAEAEMWHDIAAKNEAEFRSLGLLKNAAEARVKELTELLERHEVEGR